MGRVLDLEMGATIINKLWICQFCQEVYDYEPIVCDNCHGAVFDTQEIISHDY